MNKIFITALCLLSYNAAICMQQHSNSVALQSLLQAAQKTGIPALHLACETGQDKIVASLLSQTTLFVNSTSGFLLNTPLHEACLNRHSRCVQELLSVISTDINKINGVGYTPLAIATIHDDEKTIEVLLAHNDIHIWKLCIKNGDGSERSHDVITDKLMVYNHNYTTYKRTKKLYRSVQKMRQHYQDLSQNNFSVLSCFDNIRSYQIMTNANLEESTATKFEQLLSQQAQILQKTEKTLHILLRFVVLRQKYNTASISTLFAEYQKIYDSYHTEQEINDEIESATQEKELLTQLCTQAKKMPCPTREHRFAQCYGNDVFYYTLPAQQRALIKQAFMLNKKYDLR